MTKIDKFKGKYYFLSNFYVMKNGKSLEHLFHAMKVEKSSWKIMILKQNTPNESKIMGNKAPLRDNWDDIIRLIAMEASIRYKFFFSKKLGKKLLETDNAELIEGNYHHDNFWGDCFCEKCKEIIGQNYSGQILMQIRKELKKCF